MKAKKLSEHIEFDFGDRVEFDSKIGKDEGIFAGVSLRQNSVSYAVVWSNKEEKWHYGFELKKKA